MRATWIALLCAVPASFAEGPAAPVVVGTFQIARTQSGLFGSNAPDPLDRFGSALAPVGDLDNDGIVDLAVGAPFQDDGFPAGGGGVWILFLRTDGQVRAFQQISELQGGLGNVLDTLDMFGDGLAALGDLNGDGVEDLVVGAPGDDDGASDAGSIWILLLNTNGTVQDTQKIGNLSGGFDGTLVAGDRFGASITALGDVGDDGFLDIAVGAPGTDAGGVNAGGVWIISLLPDGTVRSEQRIDATTTGFAGAVDAGDAFGESVAGLGDLDADGTPDLAVGAVGDERSNQGFGAVYVLFLGTAGNPIGFQPITFGQGGMTSDGWPLAAFGEGLGALGDVDGDGIGDLVAGDYLNREGAGAVSSKGAAWILLLDSDGTVHGQQKIGEVQGNLGPALPDNTHFGQSVAGLGDLNGDGLLDMAVGAPQDSASGTLAGRVYLLLLGPLANAATRNAGSNPLSLTANKPMIGTTWTATVDLTTTGHAFTQLIGYETPLTILLAGGQTLLVNVADPNGEQLGQPLLGGPVAQFVIPIPNDTALLGRCLSTQAIHALGVTPFRLSNALDLVVGY